MAAVVLLPGMDGSGVFFADFIAELKGRSLIVAYPPELPLDYKELEKFATTFLPTEEPFILLGESFSGPVAIALALKGMPQLRAIVLVCSFAKLPPLPFQRLIQRLATAVPFWRAPRSLIARMLLGRFRSASLEAKLSAAIRAVSPEVWKARARAVLSVDETASLCRIGVPVLYLRASEDRVVFSSAADVISRHVPKAKIAEIEGPHFLLQAKPRESAAAVKTFANEHGIAL